MKTIDEILDEWYPTIPDEEHNGLYARDKVKLIAREFADQFSQPAVIGSFSMQDLMLYYQDAENFDFTSKAIEVLNSMVNDR